MTLHDSLRPSPDAEAVLRNAGWFPDRSVDASEWVETLRREGNEVFTYAKIIMESFGELRLRHRGFGGPARHDFEIIPHSWYGEREHIALIEEIVGSKLCPVGETSGAAMLAVLEDGRVISELDGTVFLIGENWRAALDNRVLGRGEAVKLAEDYVPVDHA